MNKISADRLGMGVAATALSAAGTAAATTGADHAAGSNANAPTLELVALHSGKSQAVRGGSSTAPIRLVQFPQKPLSQGQLWHQDVGSFA